MIYKQASKRKLTFEELETIAKQATLVTNDTPVNARYTGSNVECLTPAMLAIGRNLDHFNISPELMDRKDLKDDAMADNFKIRNQIKNQFFTEWLNTYFGKLREEFQTKNATKLCKKSTIQNVDYFEMRGGSGFSIFSQIQMTVIWS